MSIKIVCIIATPRTGSTRFCQLLENCPEFNVVWELFNNNWIRKENAKVVRRARLVAPAADDKTVREWILQHPRKAIAALQDNRPDSILVLKVFQTHLSEKAMDRCLFSRPDIGFILLRRTPIESYVSKVKADLLRSYNTTDTTALKPDLDATHFIRWAKSQMDWYAMCEQKAVSSNRPLVHADYKSCVATDNITALTRILALVEQLGVPPVALPDPIETSQADPQDREPQFTNRVANWPEFQASVVESPETAALLQWATSPM